MSAQVPACPAKLKGSESAAELAYAQGKLSEAEELFQQSLKSQPQNARLIAELARTMIRLGKLDAAAANVRTAVQVEPGSAPLQVALADVQLREGQPWLARESLDRAIAIDPCNADGWLLRGKVDRLDSMQAASREDVARAYAIDPNESEIKAAWERIVTPANDAASTEEYLRTTKNVDPELRKAAEASVRTTVQLLFESTQTCRGLPDVPSATLPLLSSMQDGRHLDGYQVKVSFGAAGVALGLDTAASGFYVSRSVADASALAHRMGDPSGTVHADTVQVGPLAFHDCLIQVSDTAFPNKASGFLGTDLFASYLATLNFPELKLVLRPLPKVDAVIPGDRPQASELTGYSPAYHKLQYLMVPVTINSKERRLFVLDSGLRLSAMTLPLAHLVTTTRHGLTNSIKTTSGANLQIYGENFDMDFARQQVRGQSGMLQIDLDNMEQAVGMKIGGLIGLDIMQASVLSLDYRDGLVQVELPTGGLKPPAAKTLLARGSESTNQEGVCRRSLPQEVPRSVAIVASNTGMWDVHQLKLGQTVALRVERPWETEGCHLEKAALLHGRVVSLDKGHDPEPAHLGLIFDRAECFGKSEQKMALRLVSVMGEAGAFSNIDGTLPTAALNGAGRQIGDAVATTQNVDDLDLHADLKLRSVRTGSVLGVPSVSLDTAGPACSAVLTGQGSALRLGAGTRWLLISEQ